MKRPYFLKTAIVALFVAACAFFAGTKFGDRFFEISQAETRLDRKDDETPSTQSGDSWLRGTTDEKLSQIEKHLRGLDVAMAEIGYRYGELHIAARERNWEYAGYQTEKIELAMRLALERRPKRAASSEDFLNTDLPAVKKAIESKNAKEMERALDQLHNSCVACHRSEDVLHFRSSVERIRNNARR